MYIGESIIIIHYLVGLKLGWNLRRAITNTDFLSPAARIRSDPWGPIRRVLVKLNELPTN